MRGCGIPIRLIACALCLALLNTGGTYRPATGVAPDLRPASGQPALRFPFNGKWRILQGYGFDAQGRPDGSTHSGRYALDFVRAEGATRGQAVYAAHAGTVVATSYRHGQGYFVLLADRSDPAYRTYYLHLAGFADGIKTGTTVEAGAPLGVLGHCDLPGVASPCTNHLHFELTYNGASVKPEPMGGQSGFYTGQVCSGCSDDGPGPTITFNDAPEMGRWYNTDQRIAWSIYDNSGCGIRGYQWRWDYVPTGGDEIKGTSSEVWLSSGGEGVHNLYVRAWDSQGVVATASLIWLGYDTSPPETYISSGPPGSTVERTITIHWYGWDHVEGPAYQYSHFLEGVDAEWSPWMTGTSATYVDIPPGSYNFYVEARDQAGNEDPSPATLSFTVVPK
jgi:hypothetical protein